MNRIIKKYTDNRNFFHWAIMNSIIAMTLLRTTVRNLRGEILQLQKQVGQLENKCKKVQASNMTIKLKYARMVKAHNKLMNPHLRNKVDEPSLAEQS